MYMPLTCQRDLFEIPRDVAYLNAAYQGPLTSEVAAAISKGVNAKKRPWEITAADFFDEAEEIRDRFGRLIGAGAEGVALVGSVSYGIAIAAANLKANERVITLEGEFPSNYYAWREATHKQGGEVVQVGRPADDDWTKAVLEAIDERTSIVAVPNCHWTDGGFVDLKQIGQKTRDLKAALVVDGTQSIGVHDFQVAGIQPDFVVVASYKWLLGPYSTALLWVAPQHRDKSPIEFNWIARAGSEDFSQLVNYQDEYRPGARRFDTGEVSNFALLPGVNKALEQIETWGVRELDDYIGSLTERLTQGAAEIGFASTANRVAHIAGLKLPAGLQRAEVARDLAAENVFVSVRGEAIRVSPHIYNSMEDIDRLLDVLGRVPVNA